MKLITDIFLNLIAGIALWILRHIGWFFGMFISKDKAKYNRDIALAKDRLGNVLLSPLTNRLLINDDGYKFGNGKETMSSVIGKNFLTNTLTKKGFSNGLFWYNFLEKRQENHCLNAIDHNI